MRYVRLGKAGLEVSAIAFGTWAFGGDWGSFDAHDSKAAINHALDLGVTFFDTAQAYGFGVSERLLADALWERMRRDEVIVATKGGLRMEGQTLLRDASARWLRQGAEDSLRRLRTDYIDLYQVHWPDPRVPVEETAATLEELRAQGKIRAIGVSNYSPAQMEVFRKVAPLHTVQPPYNLFERGIDEDVLPYARNAGITVLAYGALCRGLLSGKITNNTRFEGDDLRKVDPKFRQPRLSQYLAAVRDLQQLAQGRYGKTVL